MSKGVGGEFGADNGSTERRSGFICGLFACFVRGKAGHMAGDCQQSRAPARSSSRVGVEMAENHVDVGSSYDQRERAVVNRKQESLPRESRQRVHGDRTCIAISSDEDESLNHGNNGDKNTKNFASRIVRGGSHLHLPSSSSSSGSHLYLPSSSSSSDDEDEKLNYWNNSDKNTKNLASGSRIVRGGISSPSSSSGKDGKDKCVIGKKNTGFFEATKEKDEECVILDYDPLQPPTNDFEDKLFISNHHLFGFEDGELIISERGKVACRDYPHSRQHCANYPFNKTCHERCCPQCYCYVCDVVAPCKYWKGHDGHCHASDHDEIWKIRREIHTQMPLSTRY